VPLGTRLHGAVIKNGVVRARMPSSELNVSAATAAYCAMMPMGSKPCSNGKEGVTVRGRREEMKGLLLL
jgi:hypothetical protein